jgi:hypothetical protein
MQTWLEEKLSHRNNGSNQVYFVDKHIDLGEEQSLSKVIWGLRTGTGQRILGHPPRVLLTVVFGSYVGSSW